MGVEEKRLSQGLGSLASSFPARSVP
jgi:hypothetical protein